LHNSQQLFLNSDLDVKWRNRGCENIPNRLLDSEHFYLIVEQMLGYEFEGVAGYVENK